MNIACLLLAHDNSKLTNDTLESIKTWMTNDIITVIDAKGTIDDISTLCIKGFWHNYYKGSYRNLVLGMKHLYENFPDHEWYCSLEYDCLIANDDFKKDLCKDYWCLGFNYKVDHNCNDFTYLEKITGFNINKFGRYLLGACIFYHHDFIKILAEMNFFQRFLDKTNDFTQGFFPNFIGYDIGEYLFPTLAYNLGGNVIGLANYDWYLGNFERYPIRWKPEITEIYSMSSLIHPIKDFFSPIRQYYRNQRKCLNRD